MMDFLPLLVVTGILLVFGLMVYSMISSARKDVAKKAQIALSLGFSACDPDENLLEQIVSAYPPSRKPVKYELKNVFRKSIPNGEMVIFDLNKTSSDEDSQVENQTVAVISPQLNLPNFALYPQADMDGWVTNFANRVMRLVVAYSATNLEFPENPDFHKKYLLTSSEPDVARRFFEPQILRRLAQTYLLNIHARGSLFTLSSIDPSFKSFGQQMMSDRIEKAMQIFYILQQRAP